MATASMDMVLTKPEQKRLQKIIDKLDHLQATCDHRPTRSALLAALAQLHTVYENNIGL